MTFTARLSFCRAKREARCSFPGTPRAPGDRPLLRSSNWFAFECVARESLEGKERRRRSVRCEKGSQYFPVKVHEISSSGTMKKGHDGKDGFIHSFCYVEDTLLISKSSREAADMLEAFASAIRELGLEIDVPETAHK